MYCLVMSLISHQGCCKCLLKASLSCAESPLSGRHRSPVTSIRAASLIIHTSARWHVLIFLPLLRGSTCLPIRMPNTLWTNYHSLHRQRHTLQLRRQDSQGPFSIGVLTLMDTRNMNFMQTCSYSSLKHKVVREQLVSWVLWGVIW